MSFRVKPLPQILNGEIVLEVKIRFGVLHAVLLENIHKSRGDYSRDSAVYVVRTNGDKTEVDYFRLFYL